MLPSHARIVIIGGGAIGCSIAYHLAKLGERDVVLLEKSGLTHGSTWHAAGLVGQLRSKRNLTRLMQHSASLYAKIEADTGQAVEWKPVGSLRLASSKERWSELKRMATTARSFGFALETLSPAEARALFPLITLDGIEGALFIATDGHVDPSSLTQAYAKGARAGGVRIVERVRVTTIEVKDRRATRVRTDKGDIEAEIVVNAAGIWARDVGRLAGIELPAGAVEHQYLVTEKRADIPAGLPTLRDPDKIFYLKPEPGAFAIGGWEADTPTFGETGMPAGFDRELFQPSMERLEAFMLAGGGAHPGAERDGDPDDHQRRDPDLAGRRADHGSRPAARQFLRRLRLHLGDRGERRRRQRHGAVDRARRAGARPLGLRRAPLRAAPRLAPLPRRALGRGLRPLLCDALAGRGGALGARRPALSRCTAFSRPGAPCSARVTAGSGRTGSRPTAWTPPTAPPSRAGRTGSAPSPRSIAPCASASRSST